MEQPHVAVLLSAYNGERYIREQINSILSQDYPNITLYVRDDGSTDGTAAVLELSLIHIWSQGLPAVRGMQW